MTFRVAHATLGPLKLTQPGRVDRWSFQTLQCVVVNTLQFGLNFGHAFVWQVMRLCPVTTLAAAVLPLRPFPGSRHGSKKPAEEGPNTGNERLSCTVRYTTRFTYWTHGLCSACVLSYCRMRAITSRTGPNTVYRLRTTYNTMSGHDREIRPAYSCR